MTEIYKQKKADKNERKTLAALITQFAPKRTVKTKNGKEYVKRPKVQRLITPDRLRRKRLLKKFHEQRREKAKKDKEAYQELVKKLKGKKEKKDKKDDKKDKKEKKAEKK